MIILYPKAKKIQPGAVKKSIAKQSKANQTRTRNDIMLRPSGLEYYHDQSVR